MWFVHKTFSYVSVSVCVCFEAWNPFGAQIERDDKKRIICFLFAVECLDSGARIFVYNSNSNSNRAHIAFLLKLIFFLVVVAAAVLFVVTLLPLLCPYIAFQATSVRARTRCVRDAVALLVHSNSIVHRSCYNNVKVCFPLCFAWYAYLIKYFTYINTYTRIYRKVPVDVHTADDCMGSHLEGQRNKFEGKRTTANSLRKRYNKYDLFSPRTERTHLY